MVIFTHDIKKFSTNMILIFSIFLIYTTFFMLSSQNHAHRKARQIVKGEKEIFGGFMPHNWTGISTKII